MILKPSIAIRFFLRDTAGIIPMRASLFTAGCGGAGGGAYTGAGGGTWVGDANGLPQELQK
jgi:hypothetical protein